jgi:hypothetical protein
LLHRRQRDRKAHGHHRDDAQDLQEDQPDRPADAEEFGMQLDRAVLVERRLTAHFGKGEHRGTLRRKLSTQP